MLWRQWKTAARFGGPGVLLGLALAWLIGGQRGLAQGDPQRRSDRLRPAAIVPAGESSGISAIISPLQPGSPVATAQLLYLIDTKARAFAIYQIDPAQGKSTIKLQGVRQFHWDLQLGEWNNHEPQVQEVEAAVKAASPKTR